MGWLRRRESTTNCCSHAMIFPFWKKGGLSTSLSFRVTFICARVDTHEMAAAATGIAKGGVKGLYFCHAFKLRSIWP